MAQFFSQFWSKFEHFNSGWQKTAKIIPWNIWYLTPLDHFGGFQIVLENFCFKVQLLFRDKILSLHILEFPSQRSTLFEALKALKVEDYRQIQIEDLSITNTNILHQQHKYFATTMKSFLFCELFKFSQLYSLQRICYVTLRLANMLHATSSHTKFHQSTIWKCFVWILFEENLTCAMPTSWMFTNISCCLKLDKYHFDIKISKVTFDAQWQWEHMMLCLFPMMLWKQNLHKYFLEVFFIKSFAVVLRSTWQYIWCCENRLSPCCFKV